MKNNVFRALKMLWKFSKKYFLIYLIISLLEGIIPIILIFTSQNLINTLTVNKDIRTIIICLSIIIITTIIQFMLSYYKKNKVSILEHQIQLKLDKEIIKKMSLMSMAFFDDVKSYDKVESASREVSQFTSVLTLYFSILSSIISLILIFPSLLLLDIKFLFIVLIFNFPIAILQYKIRKNNFTSSDDIIRERRSSTACRMMLTNKVYQDEVRAFSLFDWLFTKYQHFSNRMISFLKKKNRKESNYMLWIEFLSLISTISIQVLSIYNVLKDKILIGDYVATISLCTKFSSSIRSVMYNITTLQEKEMFLENLFSFLDSDNEIKNNKNLFIDKDLDNFEIEFRNVSFSYPNHDRLILKDFSLKINSNETMAIVGLNGAGKTTLIKLLLRFYDVKSGIILLNGNNIMDYNIESYYDFFGVMFQKPKLYPFTMKENIDFNIEENKNIEKISWLMQFVNKYPKKLETIILPYLNKEGIEPSGGEIQKIAFSRAILRENAKVYILDEPSSSLDPEVEYEIFKDLKTICNNKTCLIVSHRLSTVTIADKIVVIKDGKIEETGNHNELIKNNGEYARLFKMQSENYINSYSFD